MKKYLLECEAGVSGDMMVAAMLDLGADEQVLMKALDSLDVDGFEINISRVKKAGISACDFDVVLSDKEANHDHDMEYLHGEDHHSGSEAEHHHHDHSGSGTEHHHEHHHVHRHLSDINRIIDSADITSDAKDTAKRIFSIVAEAESKAHDVPVEEIHFHEVGAVDSIVDIISIAVCADNLGIKEMIVPYLCEGHGTVRCAHGVLPIPVPATANIVSAHDIPLNRIDAMGEFVTPTGAAAVAAFRSAEKTEAGYIVKRIGIGAGKRSYSRPSLLRLMEIETDPASEDIGYSTKPQENSPTDSAGRDLIYRLETDIDDSTGENLGYVMERLYEAGAREVHYLPVFMKKNRPGYELVVLCDEEDIEKLEGIIFSETTTIGVRRSPMERTVLKREMEVLDTKYGRIDIKKCILPDGSVRRYPEYESVKVLARESKASYQEIINEVYTVL